MEQVLSTRKPPSGIPAVISDEIDWYEEQICKYRSGRLDETKMQKVRLHFGTYAQRQEGVQMQRIKIPGGVLNADQLDRLAAAADRWGSGFMHFTTREDVQIYYVRLEEVPALLRFLAGAGITTREACGNTVRNITACYRAGTSAIEVFDVVPHAESLYRYLVRNKYNQNLGRKFKITFEGCAQDHSGLRIHDIGFLAQVQGTNGSLRRGFRVYLGGGLGAAPHLAEVYTEFLPEEEIFNLAAAVLRLFDRYGERKARMKARMKFLIQTMGWDAFRAALDEERRLVGPVDPPESCTPAARSGPAHCDPLDRLRVLDSRAEHPDYVGWVRDSVIAHRIPELRGVHVRLKLGDLTAEDARSLAGIARRFSAGELRISIQQNIYLPWVSAVDLPDLHASLKGAGLADAGAETASDVTTCPGADTCRLGIASAKGLGSAISEALDGPLSSYRELSREMRVKISGCPNGCAQHSIADVGFHAAALTQDGKTVPAYLLFLGGKARGDDAEFGRLIGKYPARYGARILESLLAFYRAERQATEDFGAFVKRTGEQRLKHLLEPYRAAPSFEEDPSFYQDWGHENERFAVRQGVKGECAGATVAETVPDFDAAREWLAQAEAYFSHDEYESAQISAYEAAARAARVPLYRRLVDPFNSREALWEFENLFVLSGETRGSWRQVSGEFEEMKGRTPSEESAREAIDQARSFIDYCRRFNDGTESTAVAAR